VLTFSLISCISQQKLEYLNDEAFLNRLSDLQEPPVNKLKPGDELYIKVASFDDVSFNFFSTEGEIAGSSFNNELSVSLQSYTVSDSGSISFPVLGKVYVSNFTIDDTRKLLESRLSEYFNQPIVYIKLAYKKVTVLGEVRSPGNYLYTKESLNIFEALGLAGDMTVHGNRKEVMIVRKTGDSIMKRLVDITNDEMVFNDSFYVIPDDIIYVKSRRSLKWDPTSTPISLILSSFGTALSSISTTLLILDFINN